MAAGGAGQLGHDARDGEGGAVGHGQALQHAARRVVRVGGDVGDGVDASGRHGGGVQRVQDLGHRSGGRPGADGGVQLVGALHAPGVVGQRRVGRQVSPADGLHEALEDAVAVAGHQHLAIGAGVGVGGRDARQRAARGLAHRTEGAVLGQQAFHAVEDGLVQRHVHHLPAPAAMTLVQGGQHADHPMQRGQRVADAHAHPHRWPPRLAGEVAQAAHGLGHHPETGFVAVRPGLAVAADAQHDQPRVGRHQRLGRQTEALQRAGAEVLHQHVGLPRQRAHQGLGLGVLQVQRHRALVARLHLPPHRGAVLEQPPLAQRVTAGRRLDLDDVGPEVAERARGERPRDELAEFEHLDAGQGAGGGLISERRRGHSLKKGQAAQGGGQARPSRQRPAARAAPP